MTNTDDLKITTLFIPNRGEIAVRIIKSAHLVGIHAVVMLTAGEQDTLAAKLADEVALVPDGTAEMNYLNIPLIIECAHRYHADAIHPGYGYLSENAELALACQAEGLIFVGPSVEHLRLMGDKTEARKIARAAGVPLLPSLEGTSQELIRCRPTMEYPILIKAALGGGGKGMTIARHAGEWKSSILAAASQGERYFGNATVYAEQLLGGARHIEVQLLGDKHGNCVHLFDRECSIQRRYQKIIEEAPAPNLSDEQRQRITDDALRIARHIGYFSAGTIEFLLDREGNHYFMEMNTRIQVEHPVTEMITDTDLVALQLSIAMGKQLPFVQTDVVCHGHAIESRIYAEDPAQDFSPSPGRILAVSFPKRSRVDTFFDGPANILPQFDPMIAKIVHHAATREEALALHCQALRNTHLIGIKHNVAFLIRILEHPEFKSGHYSTDWLIRNDLIQLQDHSVLPAAALAAYVWYKKHNAGAKNGWNAMGYWRMIPELFVDWNQKRIHILLQTNEHDVCFSDGTATYNLEKVEQVGNRLMFCLNGKDESVLYQTDVHHFYVSWQGTTFEMTPSDWLLPYEPKKGTASLQSDELRAPMPGIIVKKFVKPGKAVKAGDILLVLEAMKMENHLTAWKDGVVHEVTVQCGDNVFVNQVLLTLL